MILRNMRYNQFLKKHLNEDYKIIRLDDRSKRRGLRLHRKEVYKVYTNSERYILIRFFENYIKLFENYLTAQKVLKEIVKSSMWKVNRSDLLILIPYLGDNFRESNPQVLLEIIGLLENIYRSDGIRKTECSRYIDSVLFLNNTKFDLSGLESFANNILNGSYKSKFGYGIEDPAFNNFTSHNKKCYLVDLDNFSGNINLDYEIGFLTADVDVEFNNMNNFSTTTKFYKEFIPREIDELQFEIGYRSRLCTIVIDVLEGEKTQENLLPEVFQRVNSRFSQFE